MMKAMTAMPSAADRMMAAVTPLTPTTAWFGEGAAGPQSGDRHHEQDGDRGHPPGSGGPPP
jgi:hypothetical protein